MAYPTISLTGRLANGANICSDDDVGSLVRLHPRSELEPVLAEFFSQRITMEAEEFGGAELVSAGGFQTEFEQWPFDGCENARVEAGLQ